MNTTALKAQETYLTRLYGRDRSRILKKGIRVNPSNMVIAKEISRNEPLHIVRKEEKSLQNKNPFSDWNMPVCGGGYIKAKNNDCW